MDIKKKITFVDELHDTLLGLFKKHALSGSEPQEDSFMDMIEDFVHEHFDEDGCFVEDKL